LSLLESLTEYQLRVENTLDHWLPKTITLPHRLHEAMRYIALDGGKRIRPVLVYAAGAVAGVPKHMLDGPACAVELIHAYSLVHDDLPAMDDDDLRRGKPTCHRAFDEATAILAGDALQALSFYILAHDRNMVEDATARLKMIETLALACGSRGMAGGQALDLAATGKEITISELENMHIHKTGALIRASVTLGAISNPNLDPQVLEHLDRYAKCIGLAFQIRDDILDVESDTDTMGKPQGSDEAQNKPTYTSLLGLADAKRLAEDLHQQALESLQILDGKADQLRWISEYIVHRTT
jgi:geranylgeranyl diphosphate synthase type II